MHLVVASPYEISLMHGNDLFKICIMPVHLCGIMSCFIYQTLTEGVVCECRFEPFSVVTLHTWVHDWHPSMNVRVE